MAKKGTLSELKTKTSRLTKLRSVVVIVVAAILLELTTAVQYYSTRSAIRQQLTEIAQRDLNETNYIAHLKEQVENTVKKALPNVERLTQKGQRDSLNMVIKDILSKNEEIVGIDFCYVVKDDKKRNGIYIYKEDDDDEYVEQIIDFDFTQRSWYSQGIESNGFWSEPYMSNYKVVVMCTYSCAVRDDKGETMAVFGADIPLEEISESAMQLYEKQQNTLIPILLLHFLGLLALAFIIWRSILSVKKLNDLNSEKEQIDGELKIAREIQQSMLPKSTKQLPETASNHIAIDALLTPAREVGGDFYDFLFRDGRLFFCIGDVTGKGIPAALVMAVARSMFRMLATREKEPEHIVTGMNDTIAHDNDYNMFITLFVGVLELSTGRLHYCNAGHLAPLLVNTCQQKKEQGEESVQYSYSQLPVESNLPVGAINGWEYVEQDIILPLDTTIFLFTDGLSEAENEHRDLFGKERIIETIKNLEDKLTKPYEEVEDKSGFIPHTLVTTMSDTVESFVGDIEQSDDLTMLAIHYKQRGFSNLLRRTLTLPCDVNQTTRLAEFVESAGHDAGFSDADIMKMNLAIEEAVVNVMNYAYPKGVVGNVCIQTAVEEGHIM